MSNRITLTDFETKQIISALTTLRNQSSLDYEVIRVGQHWYDELIKKLQHQRSVETLSLSGDGDTGSVAQKGVL